MRAAACLLILFVPALAGCADDDLDLTQYDVLVADMETAWRVADADCDPEAAFALGIWRLQAGIREMLAEGEFSDDQRALDWAVAFGRMYVDSIRAHQLGLPAAPAWQAAFDRSASGQTFVLEDFLMAMNAHITHDLPIATFEAGLPAADRQDDFDRINEVFVAMTPDIVAEVADRYSPLLNPPVANDVTQQLIVDTIIAWRGVAWQGAVAMEYANDFGRAALRAGFESAAVEIADSFVVERNETASFRMDYCFRTK